MGAREQAHVRGQGPVRAAARLGPQVAAAQLPVEARGQRPGIAEGAEPVDAQRVERHQEERARADRGDARGGAFPHHLRRGEPSPVVGRIGAGLGAQHQRRVGAGEGGEVEVERVPALRRRRAGIDGDRGQAARGAARAHLDHEGHAAALADGGVVHADGAAETVAGARPQRERHLRRRVDEQRRAAVAAARHELEVDVVGQRLARGGAGQLARRLGKGHEQVVAAARPQRAARSRARGRHGEHGGSDRAQRST